MPTYERRCPHCHRPHVRRKLYCSSAHKARAGRRRRAGLPEDWANGPRGALRGRHSLAHAAEQLKLKRMKEELEAANKEAADSAAERVKELYGRRR